jgi:transposase-like protein
LTSAHGRLIERTFGESCRRVKVIGRLPGERSCLSLVWAVLDRASRGWRGVGKATLAAMRVDDRMVAAPHGPAQRDLGG